jgi:putative ABC transport system permease protein
MQTLLQDVKYAIRILLASRGYTIIAILMLALGIGANTAIFSVIHGVLLEAMHLPDVDRLMVLDESQVHQGAQSVSWVDYLDWRQQQSSFTDLAAYNTTDFNFTGSGEPQVVHARRVNSPFFALTGADMILGRPFTAAEDAPGAARTAVLSYPFWRARFGGDPQVLGKSLALDGKPYTVVGVLRPGTGYFWGQLDLIVPAGLWGVPDDGWLVRGNHPGLHVMARLRPGVSLSSARADMDTIMARLEKQYPETNDGLRAVVQPLYEARFSGIRPILLTLFAGALCVLLIACVNVANLSLARAAARQKEFAVRSAIGAGRARILRQLLTESVLLSLVGGALGLALGDWSIGPLLQLAPGNIPGISETHLDLTVFLFSFGVALVTGILFGLAPAVQTARVDVTTALKEAGRGASSGIHKQRLRSVLLVVETAIAVVLVIASTLLTRSLLNAVAVNPGFRADHLLALDVNMPDYKYKNGAQINAYLDQILERTRALPGVTGAGAVMCPPLVGTCWGSIFTINGRPVPPIADLPQSQFNVADTAYFKTIGTPLLAGRWFDSQDTANSAGVLVINETAARKWWPGENPVGKIIKRGFPQDKEPPREIVGVVGDMKQDGPDQPQLPEMWYPSTQNPSNSFTLLVRTAGDPSAAAGAVEGVIHSLDADQPIYHVQPMQQYLSDSLTGREFATLLLGLFGGLALLLAAIGIYGVISYAVTQRTHEFGIRLALGAQSRDVLGIVLSQGARLAALGVMIGIALSLALTRELASQLFGVGATDPRTFAAVAALLVAVALAACYVPARRATRVDPIKALRYE